MKQFKIFIVRTLAFLIIVTSFGSCSFGESAEQHFDQGQGNYESGNFEQAIQSYDKAIALDIEYGPAR